MFFRGLNKQGYKCRREYVVGPVGMPTCLPAPACVLGKAWVPVPGLCAQTRGALCAWGCAWGFYVGEPHPVGAPVGSARPHGSRFPASLPSSSRVGASPWLPGTGFGVGFNQKSASAAHHGSFPQDRLFDLFQYTPGCVCPSVGIRVCPGTHVHTVGCF